MPGRLCAVPVLEFKSRKSGREKPPTALDDTRWVELLVLHPESRLMLYHWAFVDWLYLILWQLQHERAHISAPSLTHEGKTPGHSRRGKSVEGGNSLRGSRKTIDRSSGRENPQTVSLSLRHLFRLQSWVTVKNINMISCFATHDSVTFVQSSNENHFIFCGWSKT